MIMLLLTAVGAVVHEVAHKRACDRIGIPVEEVCYFQLDPQCGYVTYKAPRFYGHAVGIPLAPLFTNTAIACFMFLGAIGALDVWGAPPASSTYLLEWGVLVGLSWLGISCGLHAIPSETDMSLAWKETVNRFPGIGPIFAGPIVLAVYGLSRLDWYGIGYFYTGSLIYGLFILYHSSPLVQSSVRMLF